GVIGESESMYRRIVTSLLVPVFLLTQLVSAGDRHCPAPPAGHDGTPHVHLRILSVTSSETPAHCHDEDDDPNGTDRMTAHMPAPGHDDDALYVPTASAIAFSGGRASKGNSFDLPAYDLAAGPACL